MSLQKNIFANYASQIYATAIGILILPLYINHMGAEAYGLLSFYSMLQAWFFMLDMGLTPTIIRETARYHGGSMSALNYRQMLRSLTLIFSGISIVGCTCLLLFSRTIATRWLNVAELPIDEVVSAVQIMAICIALRWMGGLYRGVISGSERLVWLSGFGSLFASLRFIAPFLSMWLFGFTPFVFFIHQLVVALLEIVGLLLMTQRLIPANSCLREPIGWSFRPVQPLLKFSLSIALSSSLWILVTQTDKLVLSGILPLVDYGYFTIAVLAASGILVISNPIGNAVMPLLTRLNAEGKQDEMFKVYRNATQVSSILTGSAAITLAICAEPLLLAWTGDPQLAGNAAPVMRLYAIGNGILSAVVFCYYLQYAKGNLHYNLVGNAIMTTVLVPVIAVAAVNYGGIGAGLVWLAFNFLSLFLWVAWLHKKFAPALHLQWLNHDVLKIIIPSAAIALALFGANVSAETRLQGAIVVFEAGAITITSAALCSSLFRSWLATFASPRSDRRHRQETTRETATPPPLPATKMLEHEKPETETILTK